MWGTADSERICETARRLGYTRLALTDTDNLCGLWPFLAACRRHGISPIVGAEVTDRETSRRAVCLVENPEGYANLCRVISRRHTDTDFELGAVLAENGRGLVILTRDPGLLTALCGAGRCVAGAMPRRPDSAGRALRQVARRIGAPVVATPGSFFLAPEEWTVHRLLRAIDGNTSLSAIGKLDAAPNDAWLASPGEYVRRFDVCPEALRTVEVLAERLTFTGPEFGIVLPPWQGRRGEAAEAALRRAAYAGARRRYGRDLAETVVDRLEHELRIIGQMGFPSYFLVVRQIVARSPRTCGRGSGAASLVAYCLGITNVCPIRYNLYFERFLNPGRTDPPDIDVDFAWDERDGVLDWVLSQFRGHAAMVANHICFQPRMAVREVAKVYGIPEGEIGRVSKRLPRFWRMEVADEADMAVVLKNRPESRGLDLPAPWPEILSFARRIVGMPRYLSVHSGGVVITPGPIDSYVPVQQAPKGVPIVQWEKGGVEEAGLVKIDLLGNRSLGVIRDAVANVRENGGDIDENRWLPETDPATQHQVAAGRTMGCFYIESPAMRLLQEKAGKGDFEHLVIHSSIIRPAANEYIQKYLERLHGASWDPIHPLLSDVLEETFGIMVYQEDVSRVATALAGFSPAEADGLRKILSKKDKMYALKDHYARFREGAMARGVSETQVDQIWGMILSFDGYSFCKPHSASYARVSFQAAWLKTHFPAEFMAAVISNQGGFYSAFAYVSEARRLGLTILPPDVNCSNVRWTGKGSTLRVGFLSVKGLSAGTRERIVAERDRCLFQSLEDFLLRAAPHEDEARRLVHCGALDGFSPDGNRARLTWALARFEDGGGRRSGPPSLFGETFDAVEIPMPVLPPDDGTVRLRREFSALGLLCDRHPMTLFAEAVKRSGSVPAKDIRKHMGRKVRIAGWLITGKKVRTKRGDTMEFLTFEDDTGLVETTFFPEIYERFCHLLDWGRPYLLSGEVEENWGAVTLTVDSVARFGLML
jgi:DNA polymerase-3 subunit alpha/error-prone DNA polymerase